MFAFMEGLAYMKFYLNFQILLELQKHGNKLC